MPTDFYTLPDLYDLLHHADTADEIDALERIARHAAIPLRRAPDPRPTAFLEPASGTGRSLRALARRGYRAIGFDAEPEMVRYARAHTGGSRLKAASRGRVTIFRGRMESFDRSRHWPGTPVHVAFNLINTIRHLPSDCALLDHLGAIARVLAPGGVYVVGLSLSAYGLEQETEDVWRASRRGRSVVQVVQYLPPPARSRWERVISHLTVRDAPRAPARHVDSTYRLRTYNLRQWTALLERSPLAVARVTDQDGRDAVPQEPGYALYVLTKRGPRARRRRS